MKPSINQWVLTALISLIGSLGCSAAITPYAGASVGYLVDSEDAIFGVHGGANFYSHQGLTHGAELEVLYSTSSDYGVDVDIVPLLANYRLTLENDSRFVTSFGAGLGVTNTKIEYYSYSDDDTAFTYQVFGSVGYKVTPKLAISATVRYLNIGEATLFNITDDVGDDTALELGVSYRF